MNDDPQNQLMVLPDPTAVALAAANQFVRLTQEATAARGRFSVALSGGGTPQKLYRLLAQSPHKQQIDWSSVHIFWGDERFVPPDDPDNLWRMARETFLDEAPLPAANIHPMPTVGLTPTAAARQYAHALTQFFAPAPPRFDLILLGLGPDGHTASLFPGQPALTDARLVTAVHNAPKPPPTRLTLTLATINQAANVIFLVTGAEKAAAVAQVLRGERDLDQWPAQGVQSVNGRLLWLLDQAAAQNMDRTGANHAYD
jgi:6-phosphogluconolactonase